MEDVVDVPGGAVSAVGLAERIADMHAGRGDGPSLPGEFRRTTVLAPTVGDGLWTAGSGGVRRVFVFTGEEAFGPFAKERAADRPDGRWDHLTVHGARLLDAVIPALDVPAGVVVDVAGPYPLFFPPLTGIVPGSAAPDGRGQSR
ncbi:hypothetical protein OG689_13585 [Kitasatospora sp. NBC_00240]|uniref:hypothetical protein n=1 Tax=Kitasatospora sp. NBC_00240 TaxID=2903567 RepID=UPI00224D5B3D|nr:hypothetical protein [Kitasatospora sp. NBC_00240]MCX5210310.1 hypothetical protein [Kitasatospora sp. NBC_00240]